MFSSSSRLAQPRKKRQHSRGDDSRFGRRVAKRGSVDSGNNNMHISSRFDSRSDLHVHFQYNCDFYDNSHFEGLHECFDGKCSE